MYKNSAQLNNTSPGAKPFWAAFEHFCVYNVQFHRSRTAREAMVKTQNIRSISPSADLKKCLQCSNNSSRKQQTFFMFFFNYFPLLCCSHCCVITVIKHLKAFEEHGTIIPSSCTDNHPRAHMCHKCPLFRHTAR